MLPCMKIHTKIEVVNVTTPIQTDYGWEAMVNGCLIEAATPEELRDLEVTEEEILKAERLKRLERELKQAWREFDLR